MKNHNAFLTTFETPRRASSALLEYILLPVNSFATPALSEQKSTTIRQCFDLIKGCSCRTARIPAR